MQQYIITRYVAIWLLHEVLFTRCKWFVKW